MQKEIVELAKLLKERNNIKFETFVIGKVISPPPNAAIADGENIILRNKKLIFAAHVTNKLQKDDIVILIPSADNQKYVVLDKAVMY